MRLTTKLDIQNSFTISDVSIFLEATTNGRPHEVASQITAVS
jgi:hypothetical protein